MFPAGIRRASAMTHEPTAAPISRDVESILRGHPYRAIMRLAWPATASMLFETLFAVVDMIWVGRLGPTPLAAVISATFVVWIMMSLSSVLTTGLVAVVARAIGASDLNRARAVTEETWRLVFLFGVIITVAVIGLRHQIIAVMQLEPEVTRLAEQYLLVYFAGSVIIVFFQWAGALYRACGNTRTPLLVFSISTVVNIVLDPLLIFGIGPFPEWGTVGAAAATVASYAVASVVFIILLRRQRLPFRVGYAIIGPMSWPRIGRLLSIGLPISVSGITFSVVYLFVNQVASRFGTESVAALGIGNRIESIDYLVSYGFALAVATLVGQNLGAGNPARAASLAHKTLLLVTGFTGMMTAIYLLFPGPLLHVFSDDPTVITAGVSYVRILALSQILMGWEIVLEGAFSGAGDTLPPMIVSIVGSIGRIPLAWALAVWLDWGIVGVWWTITISSIVKGSVLYVWFGLGRWKLRTV